MLLLLLFLIILLLLLLLCCKYYIYMRLIMINYEVEFKSNTKLQVLRLRMVHGRGTRNEEWKGVQTGWSVRWAISINQLQNGNKTGGNALVISTVRGYGACFVRCKPINIKFNYFLKHSIQSNYFKEKGSLFDLYKIFVLWFLRPPLPSQQQG